jgi:hypothetical protein
MPSAFAVLRLMTSAYFVGACTGRSAGLSPLRIRSSAGISVLNSNIAVLGPPERLEPLPKRDDAGQHFGIVLGVWMEERNTTHARRLLRARRERPRERRGAEKRYELAPLHVPLGNRVCKDYHLAIEGE